MSDENISNDLELNPGDLKVVSGDSEDDSQLGKINIIPIDKDIEFGPKRQRIIDIRSDMDRSRWDLAEALNEMHDESTFQNFGYPTWERYINDEVKMNVRTSQYLCAMYVHFRHSVGADMTDEELSSVIDQIREIGWTKARCLVGVSTAKNYEEWFEKARRLSSADLELEAKREIIRINGGDPDEIPSTKTFSAKMAEEQYEIVAQACELAGEALESKKKSHQISMICQSWLSDNMGKGEKRGQHRSRMLRRTAAIWDVDIVAVDKATGQILMGREVLKKVDKDSKDS